MVHVLVLTGASKGIGAAIAEIFLQKSTGNKLVAISRSKEPLQSLVDKFGSDRVAYVAGDVTDPKTNSDAGKLAREKFGQIDSVILNAGVLDPVDQIANADVDAWRKLYDINLFSAVDLVQKVLPQLRQSQGNVVAVLSGASTKAYNAWAAYGSSKAALNHFIVSLASEEDSINAILIAPGVVDTGMQQDIRDKFGTNMKPEALARFTDLHKKNQLLPPAVPATVYVNLALKGWEKSVNGQYLRFDDPVLSSYAS